MNILRKTFSSVSRNSFSFSISAAFRIYVFSGSSIVSALICSFHCAFSLSFISISMETSSIVSTDSLSRYCIARIIASFAVRIGLSTSNIFIFSIIINHPTMLPILSILSKMSGFVKIRPFCFRFSIFFPPSVLSRSPASVFFLSPVRRSSRSLWK